MENENIELYEEETSILTLTDETSALTSSFFQRLSTPG